MVPRFTIRNNSRTRSWLVLPLATLLALVLSGTLLTTPAHAANPVTPGNYRGLGFDQCEAPSQSAMSTWIKKSPFRAAGIYISGASRGCQRQSNLSATWVRNQLAAGWHLMPITLGPQASCSTRYPRYGSRIDPTINPSSANYYAAAKAQGKLEAQRAVRAARNLGLVPNSTLFYDLEGFNTRWSTSCTQSAIRFMHAWTRTLHTYGYASGYYSSAASGMRMMDDQRVKAGNNITMPDQIWIADWDGKANTSSSHIRSGGWQPYGRMKQYRGGHPETWGGVRINIDRNYLNLRTPRLAGVAPTPATSGPRYTGASMSDPRCTTSTINKTSYRNTGAGLRTDLIVPLQCMLKQKSLYPYEVTGRWNNQTVDALRGFQRRVDHRVRSYFTRGDWVSLLAAGNTGTVLRTGSRGTAVIRLQRALNAANPLGIPIHGVYDTRTANAVGTYQRNVGIRSTKVVASQTWSALVRGRW